MRSPPPSPRKIPPPHYQPMTQRQANVLKSPATKVEPVLMDRNVAQAHAPQTTQGDIRTDAFSYLTKSTGQTDILYTGDRLWAKVILTLETAGPVAVGTRAQITPVLSGLGLLLVTGQKTDLIVGKGTRVYIASTSVNRVSVIIEPLPWLEQITGLLAGIGTGTLGSQR